MPLLNEPAREVLRLPGATSIAWATFDADWYRASYSGATAHLADASAEAVLAFHFDVGESLGHSPNMLFDETWHRRVYPGIAALVEAGQFPSAFDAWCRGGCRERSPHWLFDESEYRRRYPDLTDRFLDRNGLVNGYDHYLWRGIAEGRIAHPFFDPALYRAGLPTVEADAAVLDGPFWHCLRRLHRGEPEVRLSVRFDPVWYLERYPEVRRLIDEGRYHWCIEHYLNNATPTAFDPVPAFSEANYLARYDDAAEEVRESRTYNGYTHFLRVGVPERRIPSEPVDLAWYAAQETVRNDLDQGLAEDAFVHLLAMGQPAGLPTEPVREAPITEPAAKTLFRRRARALAVAHARTGLDFTQRAEAALSVLMILHDQFELTMMALGSLRANYSGDIDLILIDSGSTDETRDITRYVLGSTHFRFDTNIGFLLGCNAALQFATGEMVLYLNNDTELAPGAIAAALRRLQSDATIGAVGGMIVRSHDLVQEAGNIVYRDGSTLGYGRDLSPLAPEVNFVRDVEFCSAAFLIARRALLNELEGFDEQFAPAYYEDTDLCLRIRAAGHRVVYDPAVLVRHLEYGSAVSERVSTAEIARARQLFARKHADYIARRPLRDERRQIFDRLADTDRTRVLFVEDTVPGRMLGSGFVRSNDIVHAMATIGHDVTVYPINGNRMDVAGVYADLPDTVEVMHTLSLEHFSDFIAARRDYYDVFWVARTHNLTTVRAALARTYGENGAAPMIILDTEAVASLRDAQRAELEGTDFDLADAVRRELQGIEVCQRVIAINETEAMLLREHGSPEVIVIGHARPLRPTPRPFAERAGMLFVGAFHRMDSPNYDSLCWMIDEILPLVERELGWRTRLTVVGYTGPDVTLDRFRDHPRVTLRGPVTDLEPLYDSNLVFVAPTRIAAGTPYKVHEAASFGLPVVTTGLLRRQLGWEDGRELLSAEASDPEGFADRLLMAQKDEAIWRRLREAALRRMRDDNDPANYAGSIARVLSLSDDNSRGRPAKETLSHHPHDT
jgi:GT2 family glycosyltransferase